MTQTNKNKKGENLILISNPSADPEHPNMYQRASSFTRQFNQFTHAGIGRQSSEGNLFTTFGDKPKEQPLKGEEIITMNEAQKYAQQCLEYEKYHYDDRIKLIIHRMAIKAYQSFKDKTDHEIFVFSIEKLLGIIAKKLLLNRFQLLFLEYIIQETKWKYDINSISNRAHQFQSYAHFSQAEGHNDSVKKLQIYFLYCGFYSKKSLNQFHEIPSQNIFNGYLKSLCPKFKEYFQEWTAQSVASIKISPKTLNVIFKRLSFYTGQSMQDIQNHNVLVEEIIQISPAYNAQKGEKSEKGSKKRKPNRSKKEQEIDEIKENDEDFENQLDYQSMQDVPILQIRKQSSYLANVDGLDPTTHIKGNQRLI